MISLIFIPLLVWYFGSSYLKKFELRAIDIGLPAKAREGKPAPIYGTVPKEGMIYKLISVPSNFRGEQEQHFENLILEMASKNVPKSGIQFQFSDVNTYGDLVKILNLTLKTKQEVYGVDLDSSNSFYILNQALESNYYDINRCGTGADQVFIYKQDDRKLAQIKWHKLLDSFTVESSYLIFGYLLLVIVTTLKIITSLK